MTPAPERRPTRPRTDRCPKEAVRASRRQAAGLKQIARALDNIRQVLAQTAVGSHRSERAAQELPGLAAQLRVVERYHL